MTVLVTGATGFLGGAVLRHLASTGQPATGLGRDVARIDAIRAQGLDLRAHDLTRPLDPADFSGISAIVHGAALSAPFGPRLDFIAANVTATRNIVALAQALRVARLVHISSASVSFAPMDQLDLREDAPLPRPFNAYAATKAQAEKIVLDAPALGPIVLRPRGIYGAGDTALLPRLLRAAGRGPLPLLRDGRARIDLTHVDDVVAAVMAALRAGPDATGQIFNITGGEVIPVTQIARRACAAANQPLRWRKMPLRPAMAIAGAVEMTCMLLPHRPEPAITRYGLALFAYAQSLDITKARDLLDWSPLVPFEVGLQRTFQVAS
ncbi:NAD-dependent epimerase/dehydratase family protein [Yoonia vestfoldensis]|uniref:NAD-dependent epimerase/dehydratase family protein n=1 Tax=Yoonia vestfoldensis TaxID=245188 RepID=UPI000361C30E|nr:NAD-dependent epimerase/dehydratase family protein [Yoonia vestfoldensis]